MKKLTFKKAMGFLVALFTTFSLQAQTALFDWQNNNLNLPVSSSSKGEQDKGNITTVKSLDGIVTLTAEKDASKTNTRLWDNKGFKNLRCYQKSKLLFSVPEGKVITEIAFVTNKFSKFDSIECNIGTINTEQKQWQGKAQSIALTINAKSIFFDSFTVTYADGKTDDSTITPNPNPQPSPNPEPKPQPEPQPQPVEKYLVNSDLYEYFNPEAPAEGHYVVAFPDENEWYIFNNKEAGKPYYITAIPFDLNSSTYPQAANLLKLENKENGFTLKTETNKFFEIFQNGNYINIGIQGTGEHLWKATAVDVNEYKGCLPHSVKLTSGDLTKVLCGNKKYNNFSAATPKTGDAYETDFAQFPVLLKLKKAVTNIKQATTAQSKNVYTLAGTLVLKNATPAQINQLPKGTYIINGKVVVF